MSLRRCEKIAPKAQGDPAFALTSYSGQARGSNPPACADTSAGRQDLKVQPAP